MHLSNYLTICLCIYLVVYLFVFGSICLSIKLSFYLSICLSIYLSIFLSICLSMYLSNYLSAYLSVCLSICLFIFFVHLSPTYLSVCWTSTCLSIYLPIYLVTCLSICVSICLTIYLSVYLSISVSIYCLSIHLSGCLPICPSVYLTIWVSSYVSVDLSICPSSYLLYNLCRCDMTVRQGKDWISISTGQRIWPCKCWISKRPYPLFTLWFQKAFPFFTDSYAWNFKKTPLGTEPRFGLGLRCFNPIASSMSKMSSWHKPTQTGQTKWFPMSIFLGTSTSTRFLQSRVRCSAFFLRDMTTWSILSDFNPVRKNEYEGSIRHNQNASHQPLASKGNRMEWFCKTNSFVSSARTDAGRNKSLHVSATSNRL
jgi:hypothetical protein